MTRTVVIHQPDFMPWLGFFDRLLKADLFIVLDHVQYVSGTSRSWMHRDRIKTPEGARWLSLSVQKAPLGTPIREIRLSPDSGWRRSNLNQIRENYRTAPHFADIFPKVEALYATHHAYLVDMNLATIDLLCSALDIRVERILSSSMNPVGSSNEMLVDLLSQSGATHYLSGAGARDYFNPAPFASAGIEVVWQDYVHPVYPQLHGAFVPMLSAIDMLLNCGEERSRKLLRSP